MNNDTPQNPVPSEQTVPNTQQTPQPTQTLTPTAKSTEEPVPRKLSLWGIIPPKTKIIVLILIVMSVLGIGLTSLGIIESDTIKIASQIIGYVVLPIIVGTTLILQSRKNK